MSNAVSRLVTAERKRWAQVLTHKSAEGREEDAAALLVEDLSASAIIRVLGNMGAVNKTAQRLGGVPRRNLGAAPSTEGRDGGA